ncbi:MAG: DUF333 domain-containing protein [Conchiformibius sp.]|nr:DUF333 domain-containing protein [Conchiformibius sp.]
MVKSLFLVAVAGLLAACTLTDASRDAAADFCIKQGGRLDRASGSCHLPDGRSADQWRYKHQQEQQDWRQKIPQMPNGSR